MFPWTALFLFWGCAKDAVPPANLLAQVGDRVITTQDFIRRAEYTIRPDYCAGDHIVQRKIVLNSLIAEKLLALEAEAAGSSLDTNQAFQNYLQGRQEQAMRQWFYKTHAADLVTIDSTELKEAYRAAARNYRLAFYQLRDTSSIDGFNRAHADGYTFENIYQGLSGRDSIPTRSLSWFDREEDAVWDAVYGQTLQQGQVLGPLVLSDGQVLVMKVLGWTEKPVLKEQDVALRWHDVRERLHERKAQERYRKVVAEVMQGRALEFNPAVFLPYAQTAADQYLRTAEEKREQLNQALWDVEEHLETAPVEAFPPVQKGEWLFKLDGEAWSVRDFEEALQRHPLVFRHRSMGRNDFPEQFKLAIADMIRDLVVTERAYDLGYNRVTAVRQNRQMFRDYYLSRQFRDEYLTSRVPDSLQGGVRESTLLADYLNPLVDSLQAVYTNRIEIDTDQFEEIELTRVPMVVSQRGVPFPLMVPAFPRITTDNRLDCGRKLERGK